MIVYHNPVENNYHIIILQLRFPTHEIFLMKNIIIKKKSTRVDCKYSVEKIFFGTKYIRRYVRLDSNRFQIFILY